MINNCQGFPISCLPAVWKFEIPPLSSHAFVRFTVVDCDVWLLMVPLVQWSLPIDYSWLSQDNNTVSGWPIIQMCPSWSKQTKFNESQFAKFKLHLNQSISCVTKQFSLAIFAPRRWLHKIYYFLRSDSGSLKYQCSNWKILGRTIKFLHLDCFPANLLQFLSLRRPLRQMSTI